MKADQPVLPPRARGSVTVSTKATGRRSDLDRLHQAGSLKALFPRRTDSALEAVLVNTAGGVTGGDRFDATVQAGRSTNLTVTTQAAERAYRALPGQTGIVRNTLTVGPRARINWLPQETILFEGSALDRSLNVDLHPESELLLCETLVFGRTAMKERVTNAALQDVIYVSRGGAPLYLDAIRLHGDIAAQMARPGTGNGACALATVLYVASNAEAHLKPLRALCPDTGGVSLLRADVLTLRLLAPDSHVLRRALIPILTHLKSGPLPRPWTL